MPVTTSFDIAFAAAVGIAALALAGAAFRFLHRYVLAAFALVVSGGAIAAWVVYSLRHSHPRELAVAAGGITACAVATTAAVVLRRALIHAVDVDAHVAATQVTLRGLINDEAAERTAELERTLRPRARRFHLAACRRRAAHRRGAAHGVRDAGARDRRHADERP